MITQRELISVCRQIGGMMEAGVDILRITRVLRSQTDNTRLLDLYDTIDHELTMGRGLADVLARASDVFSPFAISLVRQGEERNNLAGAFLRLADFLEKEEAQNGAAPSTFKAKPSGDHNITPTGASLETSLNAAHVFPSTSQHAIIKVLWTRSIWLLCLWMLTISAVLFLSAGGEIETRFRAPVAILLCAIIGIGATMVWNRDVISSTVNSPAQLTEFFETMPESSKAQSTMTSEWADVADETGANGTEQISQTPQSTLSHLQARENANREESVKDGTETDASDMLGRLKQRGPRRDEEEAFD